MVYQASSPPRHRRFLPFLIVAVVAVLVIALVRWVATGAKLPSLAQFGCLGDAISLTVASSPEKAGVMRQLAEDYSGTRIDEGCVEVSIVEQSSGMTMDALAAGEWDEEEYGPRPDVWSPASSGWVEITRQRVTEQDRASLIPEETPSIANSPLVIAMPRPMAEALGWPDKELGWVDLHDLADSEAGWGSVGHPEWGEFRMGKTNPNYSTSGLNATVGTYFAGTGMASDLTVDDINSSQTRAFVSAVERSIVHYGDITMTFLANLRRADAEGQGLTYVSAVAVEEMSVVHYNQGNPSGDPATAEDAEPPNVPLVAVSPKRPDVATPVVLLATADAAARIRNLLSDEARRCSWTTRSGGTTGHGDLVPRKRSAPREARRASAAVGDRARRDAGELGGAAQTRQRAAGHRHLRVDAGGRPRHRDHPVGTGQGRRHHLDRRVLRQRPRGPVDVQHRPGGQRAGLAGAGPSARSSPPTGHPAEELAERSTCRQGAVPASTTPRWPRTRSSPSTAGRTPSTRLCSSPTGRTKISTASAWRSSSTASPRNPGSRGCGSSPSATARTRT